MKKQTLWQSLRKVTDGVCETLGGAVRYVRKSRTKVMSSPQMARALPSFCSMKQLRVLLPPPHYMPGCYMESQYITGITGITGLTEHYISHLYTWVEVNIYQVYQDSYSTTDFQMENPVGYLLDDNNSLSSLSSQFEN